mmetsp:Transcript_7015/g.11733  ORF Transcript_7015/g.11733 Transcript_7015/m.11733 type:complete len:848 (+) Transcript_7015:116-2659(+)|eukprot:CAMPEP_0174968312 /NCGR_PEP_ID=MMETSP0004_2-20121128/8064_1 /TAXON_ID=420556 /ORGANISM="Ochromonas sp., Strain CCMP1393" /LENGTH=847 /DNA_ID=CAMNT_0016217531 /DNA_START=104 /DNA_END=2647 /DNA_ORIENTATION=+
MDAETLEKVESTPAGDDTSLADSAGEHAENGQQDVNVIVDSPAEGKEQSVEADSVTVEPPQAENTAGKEGTPEGEESQALPAEEEEVNSNPAPLDSGVENERKEASTNSSTTPADKSVEEEVPGLLEEVDSPSIVQTFTRHLATPQEDEAAAEMAARAKAAAEAEAAAAEEEAAFPFAPIDSQESYEAQRLIFRARVAEERNKHCLVVSAIESGEVLETPLKNALLKVVGHEGESDMQIISLIRFLYLADSAKSEDIGTAKRHIETALDSFPFWPNPGVDVPQPNFDKICFWSENHIFMTLGSCYLFRQYQVVRMRKTLNTMKDNSAADNAEEEVKAAKQLTDMEKELNSCLETKLLKIYLRAHCEPEFGAVYEVNSSVYLPYTLSALMNLFDFSADGEIKKMASKVIDAVVEHVMRCTTLSGVSNLSAGGRAFVRTRLRTHQHNINQLMNLLIGTSHDPLNTSSITDFILTTSWRPNLEQLKAVWQYDGTFEAMPMSPPWQSTRALYTRLAQAEGGVEEAELTPLYWSAGLITHPEFVFDTRCYQKSKKLTKNKHLSMLSYLSPGSLQSCMGNYVTLAAGQAYTGITLHIHKRPVHELVLTSFEDFNPHLASFQQLPWIANVSGVGVWSQAGTGAEGVLSFGITNTHNPVVRQQGSLLIASHVAPASLTGRLLMGSLFSYAVRLYWPFQLMDGGWCVFPYGAENEAAATPDDVSVLDTAVKTPGMWVAGQRGSAYVGVYCSQRCKMDHRKSKDGEMKLREDKFSKEETSHPTSRRVCDQHRHSWVVVVATTKEHATLQKFVNERCLKVIVAEHNGGSSRFARGSEYRLTVKDPVEGELESVVSLPT